ncbi:ATP-binding response regulator [Fontivita pretiosa]|uniref:ATP-binding response regulator n=1 Tax=Fontivita pretiosa TaxID=2989684 RepID=UPI003D16BBCC
MINNAVESVRPAAEAKGVRLVRVLDPDAAVVSGDAGRLQQVLWNLLSNAIKFTPRGGQVQVTLRRVRSHVQVCVADTGQGISPEFLPYLFTRFAQADASASRRQGGLGLGLAISRHLVELHGGSIIAFSEGKDQGATFIVSLPLSAMREQYEQPPSTEPGSSAFPQAVAPYQIDLSGVRVLVVDDEPDARELVRRVLEMNRAQVQTAESAAQALELLRRIRPDLVLADIGMPGEDGYQFIRKLRQLPQAEGGGTPAVALTAFARSEDRRRALLAGYQMHVPKPVEPAELLAVIASVCGIANRSTSSP